MTLEGCGGGTEHAEMLRICGNEVRGRKTEEERGLWERGVMGILNFGIFIFRLGV
jgi:hypothetical protein